jgi:hypothetical protein
VGVLAVAALGRRGLDADLWGRDDQENAVPSARERQCPPPITAECHEQDGARDLAGETPAPNMATTWKIFATALVVNTQSSHVPL